MCMILKSQSSLKKQSGNKKERPETSNSKPRLLR